VTVAGATDRIETVLPPTPASPGVARRFVEAALGRREVDADTVAWVQLLVSELVTNAVVHAGSDVRIAVIAQDDGVRVEVADDREAMPQLLPGDRTRGDGRGLAIVERVARSWGAEPRPGGKTVWFELGGDAGLPAGGPG
jgi:anti-sigma regulatory factor (Ser/Thr protein kinase)